MSGKFPAKPGAGYLARKGFRRALLISQSVQQASGQPGRLADKQEQPVREGEKETK